MPASPVVRPFYDPAYDPGAPAIVTYWAAFLGERSKQHELEMKRRLQAMDPTERQKQAQRLRETIADLEKAKVEAQVKGQEWLNSYIRAMGQAIVADTNAAARVAEAKITARQRTDSEMRKEARERLEMIQPTTAESGAVLDDAMQRAQAAQSNGSSGESAYIDGIYGAMAREKVGAGHPRAKLFAYQALHDARSRGDEAAAAAIRSTFFGEVDPDQYMADQFTPIDPDLREADMRRLYGGLGAGGAASTLHSVMQAYGFMPSPVSGGGSVGYTTGGSVSRGGAAGMGVPSGGPQVDTAQTDSLIDAYRKQLDDLMSQPESQGLYDGYSFNYLLETPFRTGDPKLERLVGIFGSMPATERKLLLAELRRTGGNVERATRNLERQGVTPNAGPEVRIATTGQGLNAWLVDQLEAAMALLSQQDEGQVAEGRLMLAQLRTTWESLPDDLRMFVPGLSDALAAEDVVAVRAQLSELRARAERGQDVNMGKWLAAQAAQVAQLQDDGERTLRARELYRTAGAMRGDLGGDVAGQLHARIEDGLRAGDLNVVDGALRKVATETGRAIKAQTREAAEARMAAGRPDLLPAEEARLMELSQRYRKASEKLREFRLFTPERPLTPEEKAELQARASRLEDVILDTAAEYEYLKNPRNPAAAERWAWVLDRKGESGRAEGVRAGTDPMTTADLEPEAAQGSLYRQALESIAKLNGRPPPQPGGALGSTPANKIIIEPSDDPLWNTDVAQIEMEPGPLWTTEPAEVEVEPEVLGSTPADRVLIENETRPGQWLSSVDIPNLSAGAMAADAVEFSRPSGGPPRGSLAGRGGLQPEIGVEQRYAQLPSDQEMQVLRAEMQEARQLMSGKKPAAERVAAAKRYGRAVGEFYLRGGAVDDPAGASFAMEQYAAELEREAEIEEDARARAEKAAKAKMLRRASAEVRAPLSAESGQ